MSNLVSSVRDIPELDIHPSLSALSPPPPQVGLLDRLSLRLGLWLLLRSAGRHARRTDRASHALRLRNERDRELREHAAQLEHLLRLR